MSLCLFLVDSRSAKADRLSKPYRCYAYLIDRIIFWIKGSLSGNCAFTISWHNELPIDVLPESTLSTDGVGMRLREVLPKDLSPQEQEILLLRYEERLSYSEIADVLKIKEASCRSRLMRAKAHLLSLYEKKNSLIYATFCQCTNTALYRR